MKDIKGIRTNYELLAVPILIMSEQWANYKTYFYMGMIFGIWKKKVRDRLSKQ